MPRPAPLPTDRLIGARLRRHRLRARLTLDELAPLGQCSPAQLDRYESGENAIPAGRLQMLAAGLGLDVTALYADTPVPFPRPLAAPPVPAAPTPRGAGAAPAVRGATPPANPATPAGASPAGHMARTATAAE